MGRLDSFELIRGNSELPFISLSKYGITFSKSALELLDLAEHVHIYIDRKNRQFAVQPCKQDVNSVTLVKNRESAVRNHKVPFVRWSNRSLLRTLEQMSGLSIQDQVIRVNGVYYEDENVIIFDLSKVIPDAEGTSQTASVKQK